MREEKELLESLRSGTVLIADAVGGRISVEDFVRRYDNFYYYEALDGHEADSETRDLFNKYRNLISLHEEVQTKIVDITYLGPKDNAAQFIAAGRITPESAAKRLNELAKKYDLSLWFERLR